MLSHFYHVAFSLYGHMLLFCYIFIDGSCLVFFVFVVLLREEVFVLSHPSEELIYMTNPNLGTQRRVDSGFESRIFL